MLEYLKS